ncbi:hypothetical protein Glove_41g136 [Diversispora epigaea]|uniref:Uncharacterized protein n=1 Tax=Diversispora epigaea TaxID=1348612 RepID=A0A397JQ42_9GLOM|nr:hypothetical protein Glove_41g136 [Diversispora epigaea]
MYPYESIKQYDIRFHLIKEIVQEADLININNNSRFKIKTKLLQYHQQIEQQYEVELQILRQYNNSKIVELSAIDLI